MHFSPSLSRASVNSVASTLTIEEINDRIGELRKQHDQNMEDFQKVQSLNRERMAQGLEEKLAARRSRRDQKIEQITPVSV